MLAPEEFRIGSVEKAPPGSPPCEPLWTLVVASSKGEGQRKSQGLARLLGGAWKGAWDHSLTRVREDPKTRTIY